MTTPLITAENLANLITDYCDVKPEQVLALVQACSGNSKASAALLGMVSALIRNRLAIDSVRRPLNLN